MSPLAEGAAMTRTFCNDGHNTSAPFAPPGEIYDGPVAIVGMAMRLPGGVRSTQDFWDMLVNKRDGRCEVPATRYNVEAFLDAVRTKHGYFLQEDPAYFDAPFFSIMRAQAEQMDPQQRLLLEIVWECLENSGKTSWRGEKVGCYVGVFGEDWAEIACKDPQKIDRYHALGTGGYALANNISYQYDFRGPSMTIQTGCSSSTVALHEACQALRSGRCSSAIVAGVNLIWTPTMTTTMFDSMVLSPSGISRTFDAKADGYGRGEAVNAIYIKPLQDALRDNDPIRAVIRSTSTNSDGKTPNITHPCAKAQEALIRSAYYHAQIGSDEIYRTGLFECHGTGTAVGDTVEASVVAKLFDGRGTVLGAVKPNVGHSEGASGITGVIKAVMCLERKVIPPVAHFETPNPRIPFQEANLQVPLEPMPWPADRYERVSVNSFGIGGSNAHVILDSVPSCRPPREAQTDGPQLLCVSAQSAESLHHRIRHLTQYANSHPARLNDLSYTLGLRREHLHYRAFTVAQSNAPLDAAAFQTFQHKPSSAVTFAFTGQGAQWPGMGKTLIENFVSFRDIIEELDYALQALDDPPRWSLKEEICREPSISRVNEAEFSQPLCTAIQIGLVNILGEWGIKPSSVVGHSSGEIAAAYAAGAISASSAIILAYYRGRLAKSQEGLGAMAVVGLGPEEVASFIGSGVAVACHNSPGSVTLAGDKDEIDRVLNRIKAEQPDTLCRRLRVKIAYHSHHMRGIGPSYECCIAPHLEHGPEMLPLFSSVADELISDPRRLDASYWRRNLECPVLFSDAVKNVLQCGAGHIFIEIGPHSALAGPLRQIFQSAAPKTLAFYIPTLSRHDDDCQSALLSTAGMAYASGVPVNLSSIIGDGNTLTDLPLYPWEHNTRYWSESRLSRDWRLRSTAHHELLGSRVVESTDQEPSWRNLLRLERVQWLWDHVLDGSIVFPGAGYITMAGEAIQQLYPETDSGSYSIRNVTFQVPLTLKHGESTEIITNLTPVEIADGVHSGWYTFTVAVYDGKTWIQHCQGQVRAGCQQLPKTKVIQPFARAVPSEKWFSAVHRLGLEYGPRFRGLQNITADPTGRSAAATMTDSHDLHDSRYTLHPTVIDQCFQLLGVAACSGVTRHVTSTYVPATIDSIIITNGGEPHIADIVAEARSRQASRDGQRGDVLAISDNQQILELKGCYLFPLDELTGSRRSSVPLAARIKWRPDIELIPSDKLLPAPHDSQDAVDRMWTAGKLCILYILGTADRIRDVDSESPYLMKWKHWIMAEASKAAVGKQSIYPDSPQWALLGPAGLEPLIEQTLAQMESTKDSVVSMCMQQVYDRCLDFMCGKASPLETLLEGQWLEQYYGRHQQYIDWGKFLDLQCHANPALRILEIGAGTGAATKEVLVHLKSPEGVRMYSQYVFSDISPAFMAAAQEKFGQEGNLEYHVLDISRNPLEQGFKPHSFDLIIASNVLHATPCLQTTLQYVHSLLARNGRFLLHELNPELLITDYIMGVLPGWWVGENDDRPDKPYVSPQRWDQELRAAGFTGAEAVSYDVQPPYQTTVSMVSRVAEDISIPRGVTLLTSASAAGEWARAAEQKFQRKGYTVHWAMLNQNPPEDRLIICFLDLDGPFLDHMSRESFLCLQHYVEQAHTSRFLWVTQATQLTCKDPRFSSIHGLARTLRHELVLDISILEIDTWDAAAAEALVEVYERIQRSRHIGQADTEYEFAMHDGVVHIGRYHWSTLGEQLLSVTCPSDTPRRLDMTSYGLLDTIRWTSVEDSSLKSGQVEVDIQYVGLNFRDMMVAMGVVGSKDEFGLEGSGVVRRIGPEVTDLRCGDRVALMHCGLLATRVVAPQQSCMKLPESLPLEDAATMLSVYVTAIYALIHVGALKKGQSVLIHSACGGVGLASIEICRMIGAEIYATVGTDEKVQYLMKTFGIPRSRIFNSRDSSFHLDLMRQTDERGVDIVLNSLAGKLLHASWECVAPFGRMIELGKRDFLTHGVLSMSQFSENRAFFGVDLLKICQQSPLVLENIMATFMDWYQQGNIKPIRPVKIFEARQIVEAFRYMQAGIHMGKILVQIPLDSAELLIPPAPAAVSFRPDASYLLVGGLGGIGRSVSTWMVEQGARELVYLSRSAGRSSDDEAFIRELELQGCHVICVQGSVASQSDVKRAVAECTRPLAGVLQMAINLQDRTFLQMSYEEWTCGLSSKVDGTWNLHHAVEGRKLDFFVVFSSIVATCGHLSQANYAAANSFLEGFTQYRRQLGLPSSVLCLGVVEEVGLVSRDPKILQNAQFASIHLLQEKDVIEGLQVAIRDSQVLRFGPEGSSSSSADSSYMLAIGLGHTKPLSDPTVHPLWTRDARFTLYSNLESSTVAKVHTEDDELRDILSQVERDPSILEDKEMEATLARKLAKLITEKISPGHGLAEEQSSRLVVDSLMSIEIKNWARRLLGIEVSLIEINKAGTIGGLASLAIDHLKVRYKQQQQ